MKCLACDHILSDYEATRRYTESKEFIDLCNKCFNSGVSEQINYSERNDLEEAEDDTYDSWWDYWSSSST